MNHRNFLPSLFLAACLLLAPAAGRADADGGVIEILAAGDVTPAGRMVTMPPSGPLFDAETRARLEAADAFIWNCETSGLSPRSKTANQFRFHADGALLPKLRFGRGAAVTANNHAFDGYEEGARFLMDALDRAGIRHNGLHEAGAYEPLPLRGPEADPQIYLLSGSPMSQTGSGPGVVTLTYPRLQEEISRLRGRDPRAVIVAYVHDGAERVTAPTARQRQWAHRLAMAGADILLFAHSHVYGPFETLENTPRRTFVAWSLGNFIFGGNSGWRTRKDVRVLSITLDGDGRKRASWLRGRTAGWRFALDR